MNRFIFIFLLSLAIVSTARAMDCSTAFAKKFANWKRVEDKLTPENLEYLTIQRSNLSTLVRQANETNRESEHAIRRILLGQMMGSHAILFGDGGAGKSDLLRSLTHIPRLQPDGTRAMDVFAITVHEQMADSIIKGWVSNKSLKKPRLPVNRLEAEIMIAKEREKLGTKIDEAVRSSTIHNAHTMIQYSVAMLDEVDKGNPITLAALLDVLNEKVAQYGFETQKVRTHFVGMTGNKTLYEFLEAFTRLGYSGTGEALLDRILFKIYMHDYLTVDEERKVLQRRNLSAREKRAMEELKNPFEDYVHAFAQGENYVSPLPDVDLRWLGRVGTNLIKLNDSVYEKIQEISDQTRITYGSAVKKNETDRMEALKVGLNKAGYQPPSSISNRTLSVYPQAVLLSSFLDLLLLPDDEDFGLSTAHLGAWINRGLEIDGISAWRLKDVIPTAATGDAKLYLNPTTGIFEVRYNQKRIERLLERSTSERSHSSLQHIYREREEIVAITGDVLDRYVTQVKKIAAIFAQHLPNSPMQSINQRGIENFLLEKQRLARELEP